MFYQRFGGAKSMTRLDEIKKRLAGIPQGTWYLGMTIRAKTPDKADFELNLVTPDRKHIVVATGASESLDDKIENIFVMWKSSPTDISYLLDTVERLGDALKDQPCGQRVTFGVRCRKEQKDKCSRCEALASLEAEQGGEK
jgi:hypothetical protein